MKSEVDQKTEDARDFQANGSLMNTRGPILFESELRTPIERANLTHNSQPKPNVQNLWILDSLAK